MRTHRRLLIKIVLAALNVIKEWTDNEVDDVAVAYIEKLVTTKHLS